MKIDAFHIVLKLWCQADDFEIQNGEPDCNDLYPRMVSVIADDDEPHITGVAGVAGEAGLYRG